jgi:hypothetical protein
MKGGLKMTERKRVQVTLSKENFEKLEKTAERYGITVNSFMAFVLGQWIDENYETQKVMSDMVDGFLTSKEDVFNNPQLLEMVKEILRDDKEFKLALKEGFQGE